MQEKNKPPFCIAPWVSIQYGSLLQGGGITPCCEWSGDAFKGDLNSYFDSEFLNTIKTAMIEHDYSIINDMCACCINVENLNMKSTRQQLHEERRLRIDSGLRIIDYRPSNLCNLKCRMCFAENSSMIAKEENKVINEYNTQDIYSLDFSNIEDLKIVGGEPSISDDVHSFLRFLVQSGHSKHIDLMVTTNATNTNKSWMDLISKFKSCYVVISLDGINKVYDYIRTNANWDSVLTNINIYENHQIDINFQVTASMYNMPVVEEWIEWFFNKNSSIFPVEGRPELSLNALTDKIRQEKIDYLSKFNQPICHSAIEILKSSYYEANTFEKFKNYTHNLDKIRKTSLGSVSPVFKKMLE